MNPRGRENNLKIICGGKASLSKVKLLVPLVSLQPSLLISCCAFPVLIPLREGEHLSDSTLISSVAWLGGFLMLYVIKLKKEENTDISAFIQPAYA